MAMQLPRQQGCSWELPHVAVADGRHSDHGPPERVWDGFEKGFLGAGLGKINCAREQYYSCGTTFH